MDPQVFFIRKPLHAVATAERCLSVMSIALANVERYVSIRHPMQHAAHLTVGRTLAAIAGVWVAALGVAATPVVAQWEVLDTGTRHCDDIVVSSTSAAAFVVVVVALLFVAPSLMMAAMCCSIYRVARQAGRRVAPGVEDGGRPAAESTFQAGSTGRRRRRAAGGREHLPDG